MKFAALSTAPRRQSGILLTECLVYMMIFSVLFGVATGAFYLCWDHTRATIAATNNIEMATLAGERWRADIRQATGKITSAADDRGQNVRIPEAKGEVVYRFAEGSLTRQAASASQPQVLLPSVKVSDMKSDARNTVTAWRWDLELMPTRKQTSFSLRFTFEAAAPGQ